METVECIEENVDRCRRCKMVQEKGKKQKKNARSDACGLRGPATRVVSPV